MLVIYRYVIVFLIGYPVRLLIAAFGIVSGFFRCLADTLFSTLDDFIRRLFGLIDDVLGNLTVFLVKFVHFTPFRALRIIFV